LIIYVNIHIWYKETTLHAFVVVFIQFSNIHKFYIFKFNNDIIKKNGSLKYITYYNHLFYLLYMTIVNIIFLLNKLSCLKFSYCIIIMTF